MKHTHYDFRDHAAIFKVRSDRTNYGVCILPHRWGDVAPAHTEGQSDDDNVERQGL